MSWLFYFCPWRFEIFSSSYLYLPVLTNLLTNISFLWIMQIIICIVYVIKKCIFVGKVLIPCGSVCVVCVRARVYWWLIFYIFVTVRSYNRFNVETTCFWSSRSSFFATFLISYESVCKISYIIAIKLIHVPTFIYVHILLLKR